VGTELAVSRDAPALDMAYKLVEYAGVGRTKLSSGKVLLPGRKQVFRQVERGLFTGDIIARADEALPGMPLLVPVMKDGRRLSPVDADLPAARRRARAQIEALPPRLRALDDRGPAYPVSISNAVANDLEKLRRTHR
jgi:nicotinate phosphoribosyltransferase